MDGEKTRTRWFLVPLYVLGALLIAADVWGVVFWARVGGSEGLAAAAVGTVVALVLGFVLIRSARRHWRSPESGGVRDGRSTS